MACAAAICPRKSIQTSTSCFCPPPPSSANLRRGRSAGLPPPPRCCRRRCQPRALAGPPRPPPVAVDCPGAPCECVSECIDHLGVPKTPKMCTLKRRFIGGPARRTSSARIADTGKSVRYATHTARVVRVERAAARSEPPAAGDRAETQTAAVERKSGREVKATAIAALTATKVRLHAGAVAPCALPRDGCDCL